MRRLAILLGFMLMTNIVSSAEPKRLWAAYWVTGGEAAKSRYEHLLITQFKLEELSKPGVEAAETPPFSLESSTYWISTHARRTIWNTDMRPIKAAPKFTDYDSERNTLKIAGVEYEIEPVPIARAIQLLREPFGDLKIHRLHAPLSGMERTAEAIAGLLEAETQPKHKVTKLNIGGSFGGDRSTITTQIAEPHPLSGTRHGPFFIFGEGMRLREWHNYDEGFRFYRDVYIDEGFKLVHEQFSRKPFADTQGANGCRVVYKKGEPGKGPTPLTTGYTLDEKPWFGEFVFFEVVPGNRSFEYPVRLILREYDKGKMIKSKTDFTLGFGEEEKSQKWLKKLPDLLRAP
ncbi:MAG: hypothetical protein ACRC8S_08920 [Fimbriiglobus sp.]